VRRPLSGGFLGAFIPESGADASHVVSGDTLEELAAALDERLNKLGDDARNIRLRRTSPHRSVTRSSGSTGFARGGVDEDFRRARRRSRSRSTGPVADDTTAERAHVPARGARSLLRNDSGARTLDTRADRG